MREAVIEKYLCQQVKKHGGLCEKFKSPGRKNVPDRIVSWPNRRSEFQPLWTKKASVHFVELKKLLGKISPGQKRDHNRRRKMGLSIWVLRSKADVDYFINLTK